MTDTTPTSVIDGSIEVQIVGAIKLALEGATDDQAALSMVRWLVDCAPPIKPGEPGDKASVALLIDVIRALGFSVSTESPSGAYAAQ